MTHSFRKLESKNKLGKKLKTLPAVSKAYEESLLSITWKYKGEIWREGGESKRNYLGCIFEQLMKK